MYILWNVSSTTLKPPQSVFEPTDSDCVVYCLVLCECIVLLGVILNCLLCSILFIALYVVDTLYCIVHFILYILVSGVCGM